MSAGAARFARALVRTGPDVELVAVNGRRWASATFAGERQVITVTGADTPALHAWLAGLAEAEWQVPRVLVADLTVSAVTCVAGGARATVEALLLDRD